MNLSAPIYQLKRNAKLLGREAGIPLNKALAQIAQQEGYQSWGLLIRDHEAQQPKPTIRPKSGYLIETLPVNPEYRREAIELANSTFEMIVRRIEPDNPKETRALWDAAEYIDDYHLTEHLTEDILPIDSEYALSLIEAFLLHYVIDLAVQADDIAMEDE